ncbi:hypothetical protein H5410_024334 [Solanum commersonii]|uniref:Uncharacterized protein n=1 Tax=Solanum commersonii TaxID=4109 RepID=A0A9J5ZLN1_SOLCO|nr:hypothetical protein H5410_024334 [Solanum commersonii]
MVISAIFKNQLDMRRIGRPRANFLKKRMRLYDSSTSGKEEHKNCITIDDSFTSQDLKFNGACICGFSVERFLMSTRPLILSECFCHSPQQEVCLCDTTKQISKTYKCVVLFSSESTEKNN